MSISMMNAKLSPVKQTEEEGRGNFGGTGAVWISFRLAPFIASTLGRTGINVVTRIMGLIMAAIGIEFIANGLKQLFPGLS